MRQSGQQRVSYTVVMAPCTQRFSVDAFVAVGWDNPLFFETVLHIIRGLAPGAKER